MMTPSDENNEEHNAVQRQINQTTNESLEATRRMHIMMVETHDVGGKTIVMVDEQGEQLDRIEGGLGNIHAEMNKAEENLKNLKKCFGLCVLPWHRLHRSYTPFTNGSTTNDNKSSSPTTTEPKLRMADAGKMASNDYITRITNDDRELEMEDNLQSVGYILGDLRNTAVDIGNKIKDQTDHLTVITEKTELENRRIDTAIEETNDLIRRA